MHVSTTKTYYDFEGKFNFHDANFIIHPENFYVSLRTDLHTRNSSLFDSN